MRVTAAKRLRLVAEGAPVVDPAVWEHERTFRFRSGYRGPDRPAPGPGRPAPPGAAAPTSPARRPLRSRATAGAGRGAARNAALAGLRHAPPRTGALGPRCCPGRIERLRPLRDSRGPRPRPQGTWERWTPWRQQRPWTTHRRAGVAAGCVRACPRPHRTPAFIPSSWSSAQGAGPVRTHHRADGAPRVLCRPNGAALADRGTQYGTASFGAPTWDRTDLSGGGR